MGYKKTRYPGIFIYEGPNRTSYGIDFYVNGKKVRKMVGPLLTEARAKLEEYRAKARNGEFQRMTSRKKVTFNILADKYLEVFKDNDRAYYIEILREHFGPMKVFQIGPLEIENFKVVRKDTPTRGGKVRNNSTVNRELEILRRVLSKAVEWGMLEKNPFDRMRNSIFFRTDRGRVRYLTAEEMKRLFQALDDMPLSYTTYLKPIILTALLTGLRRGDILSLKWEDVDFDRGVLFFYEQKKKQRKAKILNSDMIALLKELPRDGSVYIFHGPDGEKLKDITSCFRGALKRAGINNFHFHDLRHTSASYMVMQGASLKAVQEHLGHTSLAMTQRYAHLSPEFQKQEEEKLNGVFLKPSLSKVQEMNFDVDTIAGNA